MKKLFYVFGFLVMIQAKLQAEIPPVVDGPPKRSFPRTFVYDQQVITSEMEIISKERIEEIIAKFRRGYPLLGSPRFLIYVNRELVDDLSGMKLAAREETTMTTKREASKEVVANTAAPVERQTQAEPRSITINAGRDAIMAVQGQQIPGKETIGSTEQKVAHVNKYEFVKRRQETVRERQLVRDVEQVFGRRLRSGGASLADQRVATQLIGDRPLSDFTKPTEGEQAHKDRVALLKIADVVVEILITNQQMPVTGVSGTTYRDVPVIHATAIRLSDSKIIGQANAWDVIGKKRRANFVTRNFSGSEIADATALLLMDDMMTEVGD